MQAKKSGWGRVLVPLLLAALVMLASPPRSRGDDNGAPPEQYVGTIAFISDSAVEVGGHRALITSRTSIVSDGHAVSVASIQKGMKAEMEVDSDGQALELRVTGVVE